MVADLDKISLSKIEAIIEKYPYFALARREFHIRKALEGERSRAESATTAALYAGSRRSLAQAVGKAPAGSGTSMGLCGEPQPAQSVSQDRKRDAVIAGGDYFSQEELSGVGKVEVPFFARRRPEEKEETQTVDTSDSNRLAPDKSLYTETLAQIYANQGFSKQAIDIYSKLILLYPEKSAYFASLIRELETKN